MKLAFNAWTLIKEGFMTKLLLIGLMLASTSAFAGKCKIRYELEISDYNNTSYDYYHCSGNSLEETVTRRNSKVIRNVESFKACKAIANNLIGEPSLYEVLVMVVPHGQNHLYASCKGKISKIRKIKFKK